MITKPLPDGGHREKIHGVMIHSTGDGVPREKVKRNVSYMEAACAVYESMGNIGPNYCIAPDGGVVMFREPNKIAYHCKQEHRREFLDGSWATDYNRISRPVIDWWRHRWPGVESPAHLYPGVRPNDAYVGIELVPAGTYVKSVAGGTSWSPDPQYRNDIPGRDQRYTVAQYVSLARLIRSFNLDLTKTGVLVGHEDIEPYNRGGYDPGDYHGWFSWNLLNGLLRREL